jgi:Uma2 family endonuclease
VDDSVDPVWHDLSVISQPKPRMTYAEYLALEKRSAEKHEYLRGEVWAMAGGTPTHAKLQVNVSSALSAALRGRPCGVYSSDLRVRVQATDRSTYPDVTVVCGKRETASDDEDAVVNPVVIVEVLSASTEASDRGEKFAHYQRLPSLMEYVLVNHEKQRVEVFRRGAGIWEYVAFEEGQTVHLKALDVNLDMTELYSDPNA